MSTGLETAESTDLIAPPAPAKSTEWLPSGIAWYAVGMVALLTVFGQMDFGIMSLLIGPIKHDTHMSDTQISLLMGAAFSAIYACSGLPMARVSDRGRRSFILPAALALWSLGTLLCGVAQSFWQFFMFRGLIGGATSVKGPATMSLIPDLVPREQLPTAFGIYNVALGVGQSLSAIIGGFLLGYLVTHPLHLPWVGAPHPWQAVYILLGVPGIVVALIFMLTVPEPARHGRRRPDPAPISEVAAFLLKGPASRVFIPLILASVVNFIYFAGVGAWRFAFFERTYHLTARFYGPITGYVGIATALLGAPLGAWISRRMSARWHDGHMRLVVIVHLCSMPISILSPLMPNFGLALLCQALSGLLIMVSAPSQYSAMQIITPNEIRAQVNAVYMFTLSVIGTGLGPTAMALLTDNLFHAESGLRYSMVTAAAIATPLVLLGMWLAMKPYGELHRQITEAEGAG
jgi:MFS family permease